MDDNSRPKKPNMVKNKSNLSWLNKHVSIPTDNWDRHRLNLIVFIHSIDLKSPSKQTKIGFMGV